MIAPSGVGGGTAAARISAVNDVIVDQRRTVEKLDDGGQANGATILAAGDAGG
jgi:hypothetical protein